MYGEMLTHTEAVSDCADTPDPASSHHTSTTSTFTTTYPSAAAHSASSSDTSATSTFAAPYSASAAQSIRIRPYRNGSKCFEAPGVEPVFLDQEQAIDYAKNRACFRSGEIRVLDSGDAVARTLAFADANRPLMM